MNQLKYVRSRSTEKVSPFGRPKKVPHKVPSTGRPCVEVLKSSRPQSPRSQDKSTTRVQQILNLLDNHLRAQQTPIRKTSLHPFSTTTYSQSDLIKLVQQEENVISPSQTIKNRFSKQSQMNEKQNENQKHSFEQSNDWKNKLYNNEKEQNAADSQIIQNKSVSKSMISKQYLLDFMKVLDMSQDKFGDIPSQKLQNSKIQNAKNILSTPQLSSLRSSQDNFNDKSKFKLNYPNEIDENFNLDQVNPLTPNQIPKNQESTTRTQQSINFQEIYETNKLHYEQPYIDSKQQQEEKYQRRVKEIEIMAVPIDYETIQKNISGSYEEMEIVLELGPQNQNLSVPSLNLFNNNRKGKQNSLVITPNPILEQMEEEDTKQSERNQKLMQIENYSQLKTDKSEVLLVKEVKDTEIQTSQIIEQGNNDNERLDTQQSNSKSNVLQIKQHFENMGSTNDAQSQTKFKKKNLGIYSYEISFLSPCSKKSSQAHLDLLSGDTSTQTKHTINPTQLIQPLPRLRIQSSIKENSQQSMMSAFNFETPQMSGTKNHQLNFCKQQQQQGNNDSQSYLLLTQQSDLYKQKEQLLDPPSESYDQYMQANLERIWAQDAIDMNSNRYEKKKNSNHSRMSKKSNSNQTINSKGDSSQFSQHLRQIQSMQKKQLDPYFEYKRAVNKSLATSNSTQKKKCFK